MADRDYQGYGSDRRRDRDREAGGRADDERRSWSSDDYGRGRSREGGAYGEGAWREAAQRSLQHEDQRYGSHRDTGETWGQGRSYRDQMGREDFGQYGQTGAGGDYNAGYGAGYGRERGRQSGRDSNRQFGRGGYGEGGSRGGGSYAGSPGGAFGAGGYGAYADAGNSGGDAQAGGDYGRRREDHGHARGQGQGQGQGQGMTFASHHGDFEPDYLHWRNTQMQNLDQDYLRWREERRSKFAKDFDDWRKTQGGRQGQPSQIQPSATGHMHTAGQGSSGGVSPDHDRPGGLTTPTVDRMASGDAGLHGREDKKKS